MSSGTAANTFATRLESFGDHLAVVVEGGRRLTYLELAQAADEFASRFPAGRPLVAIEAANALEPLLAYLGALRRGCPVLLLASGDGRQHADILETYRPGVLVLPGRDGWRVALQEVDDPALLHPDLAMLLSTSGSTGAVKLVRLSSGAIDANAQAIADYLGLTPADRAITTLPMHYCYGLSVVNSHLARGATVLLTDRSVTEPELWRFFEAEGGTSFAGVPYTFELLDRIGFQDRAPASLRTLTQAGGRLPPESVRRYGAWAQASGRRLFVMYGQTEATARMAYVPPEVLLENLDVVGVPIPGGAFRLADETGHTIEVEGGTGELVYSGPNVMMGYASSTEDLGRGSEISELFTGDLAQKTPRGFYRIVGRKSRFSKLFGLRLSLDEIEAGLRKQGLDAVVAGDDSVIAVSVAGASAIDGLAERLADTYGVPAACFDVAAVGEHPRLASGKADLQAILADAKARRSEARATGGGVTAAFKRTFPGVAVLPDDSFVSLGGDSLSYVTLSMEVEGELGQLPERWETLSVAELEALGRPTRAMTWWRGRTLESEVLIRALAIIGVIVTHMASGWVVAGGAEVLLMLSGYNLSRYQLPRLVEGRGSEVLWSFLKRVIAPYYAILAIYFLWKRELDIPSLLLVSNAAGRFGGLLEPYWFLEALTQCFLLVVLLFAVRPVRAGTAANPWGAGLFAFAAAIVVKIGMFAALGHEHLLNRTLDSVFYLFALGWCLHQATTLGRRAALSAIVLVLVILHVSGPAGLWMRFSYPADMTHAAWLLGASGAILWAPRIVLPTLLRGAVSLVAAASFYVYLTHGVVVHALVRTLDVHNAVLVIGASLGVGIATWFVVQRVGPVMMPKWAGKDAG